ncbi:thiamine-phosphate pyrophosphorylase [Oscillibacter valericigenes Sjm18-20]|nr:thiamine-phosphate pyrophosphorylase [Oscillibacter valericigenes Sjm18-20]
MELKRNSFRLYAVTDRAWLHGEALADQVAKAITGGAGFVQLREKALDNEEFLAEAKWFVPLCRKLGAVSIINDSVEIALASGADGVHVGQEDMAAAKARSSLGPDKIVGVSVHNVAEALAAQAAGADYLGVGAAFASHTKAEAKPLSIETIRSVTAAVRIPVIAIGGIKADNISQLSGCGLDGVAVVSALFAQPDVESAARQMLALSEKITH